MASDYANYWVVEFQTQNRGHRDTRLCPSIVLDKLHYTLFLQLLPIVYFHTASSPRFSYSLSVHRRCPIPLPPLVENLLLTASPRNPVSRPPNRFLREVQNRLRRNILRDCIMPLVDVDPDLFKSCLLHS